MFKLPFAPRAQAEPECPSYFRPASKRDRLRNIFCLHSTASSGSISNECDSISSVATCDIEGASRMYVHHDSVFTAFSHSSQSSLPVQIQIPCESCGKDVSAGQVIKFPCGHKYDTDCVLELVTFCLYEQSGLPRSKCCDEPLPLEDLGLDDDIVEGFREKAEEFIVSDPLYCSNDECNMFLGSATNQIALHPLGVSCPICGTISTCPTCTRPSHKNPSDCAKLQEEAAVELCRANGWTQCPRCRTVVERTSGCDAMACACGSAFCYACGGVVTSDSYHYCSRRGYRTNAGLTHPGFIYPLQSRSDPLWTQLGNDLAEAGAWSWALSSAGDSVLVLAFAEAEVLRLANDISNGGEVMEALNRLATQTDLQELMQKEDSTVHRAAERSRSQNHTAFWNGLTFQDLIQDLAQLDATRRVEVGEEELELMLNRAISHAQTLNRTLRQWFMKSIVLQPPNYAST